MGSFANVRCDWHTAVAYVIPFDSPTTRMDTQTALFFLDLLNAQNRDRAQTALLKLGVMRQEDAQIFAGQVSIARVRIILTRLSACFRLHKKYKGLQYLRTISTMGTCPHEL